jgi:sirohydrochlorin ferrochelatase
MMLGEPADAVRARLVAGRPTFENPTERNGRRVWYARSVGSEPLLVDVIVERVREAVR